MSCASSSLALVPTFGFFSSVLFALLGPSFLLLGGGFLALVHYDVAWRMCNFRLEHKGFVRFQSFRPFVG